MVKIKFYGVSDNDFTKGHIYTLINLQVIDEYVFAFIENNFSEIKAIPYDSMGYFNSNWRVANG